MNSRFFALPEQRQNDLLNAGFQVFSQHDYERAPMSQIAQAGGVSKSLLFHYFTNKRELYLYLWNYAARVTAEETRAYGALDATDVFDMLLRTTRAKCHVMRTYPYLFAFSMKAYYERSPEVAPVIQAFIAEASDRAEDVFARVAADHPLRPPFTPNELYQHFLMLADGYMYKHYAEDTVDADVIEKDFTRIISLWKQAFSLEERHD